MQLFYDATLTPADTLFSFDKEESKHIIKVLRKKDGDILHVTNGLGYLFISPEFGVFKAYNSVTTGALVYNTRLPVLPIR